MIRSSYHQLFIVKYLHIFILFPFWFQSFDSNWRMCYNFQNQSTTWETLVPQPCNVSHQLLTIAVTSSLFSFYFVIITFQFIFSITSTNSWTVFRGWVVEWGRIIVVITPRSTEMSPIFDLWQYKHYLIKTRGVNSDDVIDNKIRQI